MIVQNMLVFKLLVRFGQAKHGRDIHPIQKSPRIGFVVLPVWTAKEKLNWKIEYPQIKLPYLLIAIRDIR